MTKKINGVQKKVLQALRKPTFLGFMYGSRPVLSNKQLSNRLAEPSNNITYATNKLKEKGLIKDTEVLEGDKTGFKLKEEVNISKKYDFESIIDNTSIIQALSGVAVLVYAGEFSYSIFLNQGLFAAVFLGGLVGLLPSFLYNMYEIWGSLDSYKLEVDKSKTG